MLKDEYIAAAEIVSARIHKRRQELNGIPHASKRAAILESELLTLYRERSDVLESVKNMEKYCTSGTNGTKGGDGNAQLH